MAAFYIILDHFKEESADKAYHSDNPINNNEQTRVVFESNSEFGDVVNGRQAADIWPIMDELMTTLQVINPRLYAGVMRRLAE